MRFRRIALLVVVAALGIVASAAPAAAAVAISAPPTVNLGSGSIESGEVTAQMGLVTVTGSGITPPSFVATVTVSAFTTGAGGPNETIPPGSIRYWSGPAISSVGLKGGGSPGQRQANQAVDMSAQRVAFSGNGSAPAISVSWNPTIIIDLPASLTPGTYTGTITHSVA